MVVCYHDNDHLVGDEADRKRHKEVKESADCSQQAWRGNSERRGGQRLEGGSCIKFRGVKHKHRGFYPQ